MIRFDSVPTFDGITIHKLPDKVSELSKLAAWDYEDILQVSEFHYALQIKNLSLIK